MDQPSDFERGALRSFPPCQHVPVAGDVLRFTVFGEAKPGGSKRAFNHPTSGRVIVTEDAKNRSWRQSVASAGMDERERRGWQLIDEGPLDVMFVFYRARPKGHYGSGRNAGVVKQSAPAFPTTRPDVLKLARAAEDALTGVVWRDDAQIVDERLVKRWGEPRLEVQVMVL